MNEQLTCFILDDEPAAIERMVDLISTNIPELRIVDTATNPLLAIEKLAVNNPDILFTDIMMPEMSGLDFLEQLRILKITTQPIIVSAMDSSEYIIKGIALETVRYLIKPVSKEELIEAVEKARDNIRKNRHIHYLEKLIQAMKDPEKITFKTMRNTLFYEYAKNIIAIKADEKVSILYISGQQHALKVNHQLKQLEEKLCNDSLIRIGKSHILNLNFIKQLNPKDHTCTLTSSQHTVVLHLSEQAFRDLQTLLNTKKPES